MSKEDDIKKAQRAFDRAVTTLLILLGIIALATVISVAGAF